jgi:hypothetical protein
MLLVTVRDDLAEINTALDEIETTGNPERRQQLLAQALVAARRALDEFSRDADLATTLEQARDSVLPYAAGASAVMTDAMLFGAFIQAERRLLGDLGLNTSAVDRLTAEIRDVGSSSDGAFKVIEDLQGELNRLQDDVTQMQELARSEEAHAQGRRVLRRVFLVVGGSFVVGANALVGAGATPITGGLSIVGAAVSATLGSEMVAKAFD